MLAVGLVLVTTGVVATVARFVMPGLSWPAAVALGAIVSPPDAIAASAIARRLGIAYRVVTVLEGESLINDVAALVLYRSAVGAAVTGVFSLEGGPFHVAVAPGHFHVAAAPKKALVDAVTTPGLSSPHSYGRPARRR